MSRFLASIAVLFLLEITASAQSVGNVKYGSQVFHTGLPSFAMTALPADPPMMTSERKEIVIRCIEKTFGKIKEYKEYYGECNGMHCFDVTLESGDKLDFEEGYLMGYELVSSRFSSSKEWFKGGLRVGQKPAQPINDNIVIKRSENDPNVYDYADKTNLNDVVLYYVLDKNGLIIKIVAWFNEC